MKRSRITFASLIIAGSVVLAGCADSSDPQASNSSGSAPSDSLAGRTLTISSWGGDWTEYTKKYLADPFSEQTGVDVKFVVNGENPNVPVLLQAQTGNQEIDLVDVADSSALRAEGLLTPFPDDLVEALEASSRTGTVFDDYWETGTIGFVIACNPAVVQECPKNASDFFNAAAFPGDRMIVDQLPYPIYFALLADGASPEELESPDLDRAFEMLEAIKPNVKIWADSGEQQQQALADGEVGMALIWSTSAFALKQTSLPGLQLYWDDSMTPDGEGWYVPADSPNADVAFAFMKWVSENPEAQAAWTEALAAPMPTNQLESLLSPELYESLPASFDPTPVSYAWFNENKEEVRDRWQDFLL